MREFLKKIYRYKISFVFFFNLGYSEFATILDAAYKIGVVLAALKILFKIAFSATIDGVICITFIFTFYIIGKILVKNHMTQYANKLANSYNPELSLINKIAEKLGIL